MVTRPGAHLPSAPDTIRSLAPHRAADWDSGSRLRHRQALPLTSTSDLLAQVAPLAYFQQSGGVLSLLRLGINVNHLQHSFVASIMIKSSLVPCGLGLPPTGLTCIVYLKYHNELYFPDVKLKFLSLCGSEICLEKSVETCELY